MIVLGVIVPCELNFLKYPHLLEICNEVFTDEVT